MPFKWLMNYYQNLLFMKNFYSDTPAKDIVEYVKLYYVNNPSGKDREVIDVLLSGCR